MVTVLILLLTVVNTAFMVSMSRLLVRMQESDHAKIRRFLEARGLVDLPMAFEGQRTYSDVGNQDRRSGDLRYVRDN